MERDLDTLSVKEFEELIEHVIDRRLEVWLTQLMDALIGQDEQDAELRPEFADSLKRSLDQVQSGEGINLTAFREQIGR